MTQDFGQAARYHALVIALRVPMCLSLGIATTLAASTWIARPTTAPASAPNIEGLSLEELRDGRVESFCEPVHAVCNPDDVASVVIRGQFTSHAHQQEGFAISFAGSTGRYTAITDQRGYFEVRIPSQDFEGDVCDLPLRNNDFSDEQMTLKYTIDVERRSNILDL